MSLVPSEKGTIFLVTNYTGDRLHFGLAAEKAKAQVATENVIVLPATDDVSIGRSKIGRVGRRGLPGHVFTMKVLCAAAAEKKTLQQCLDIGRAMNDQTVSIGSALDHCHVPGRQHQSIADDVCVLGAGIHNEPGQQLITPFPSVEDLVDKCLKLLCDETDPERGFVHFEAEDKVLLLVNNYGGLSVLELGAIADEVQSQLSARWNIVPCRALCGTFETSLNAPGFSISLCNVSAASKQSGSPVDKILGLLDRPTTAVAWPNPYRLASSAEKSSPVSSRNQISEKTSTSALIQVNPEVLKKSVRTACEFAIAAEPKLTEWDMVMGDGDCGEAVKGLAESVINRINANAVSDGSILGFLESLGEAVDDMGGTLGAIFGILLAAFSAALQSAVQNQPQGAEAHAELFASALGSAVESLKSHTSAREGDRTVMDVLLPFADEFSRSASLVSAVKVAAEKAEATRFLRPKFGRASYVGEAEGQELPDPGAWALYEITAGLAEGLGLNKTKN
ncbi:dihydroxyacetone kinase [Fusarium albosuccineum]|uniref:Dihydroxyacetone kinase n=1 Tax=Fusarium albosuccineum TaxID=1237068 RepID=A0A8H4KIJ9_9HYPO|nr:dihydroxyacetone kinase [Fusarium albosuccineum]